MLFLIIVVILVLLILFALSLKIKITALVINTNVFIKMTAEVFYFINLNNFLVFYIHKFKPKLYVLNQNIKLTKKKKSRVNLRKLISLLKVKKLSAKIKVGCGDVYKTAIVGGVTAILLFSVGKALYSDALLQCEPDYSNKIFLVKIDSIIGI